MPRSAKTTAVALAAAGFFTVAPLAALTPLALADTSGNGAVGGGNQIDAEVDAPINACGNAVAVLGLAGADCEESGATTQTPPAPEPTRDDCEEAERDAPGYGGYCEDDEQPQETPVPQEPSPTPTATPTPSPDETSTPEAPRPGAEEDHDVPAASPSASAGADSAPSHSAAKVSASGPSELPITGPKLMALIAVALTAVVSGAGMFLLSRRRGSAVK